jgi:hypothetical protein
MFQIMRYLPTSEWKKKVVELQLAFAEFCLLTLQHGPETMKVPLVRILCYSSEQIIFCNVDTLVVQKCRQK